MIRMGISIIFVMFSLFFATVTWAVSDGFIVGVTIGSDTNPPTIPAPVSVVPVSSSQIDVTWGASVDDQSLSGYKVFRDAVQIATTTLLTYSDTGLLASTTYTYTIQAYDWMLNISTSSATVATTTLQNIISTTSVPTAHNRLKIRLTNLDRVVLQNSAKFTWETNTYAKYLLRWGKQDIYDLGFVQTEIFAKSHQTIISDLEPGTTYRYELIGYGKEGKEHILSRDSFTTLSAPSDTLSINISNFHAVIENDSVRLFWNNPTQKDFKKIRILRNYNFYPNDTSNGFIVYEGTADYFFDKDALQVYKNQYYTIFAYDIFGNISSGSVVFVHKNQNVEDGSYIDVNQEGVQEQNTQATSSNVVIVDAIPMSIVDIDVFQNDVFHAHTIEGVYIYQHVPVVLQIPYSRLPEHLKTIVVTIDSQTKDERSYLLRIDTTKSVYKAVLPPFLVLGAHTMSFEIYDYQTQKVTLFEGVLRVEPSVDDTILSQKTMQYVTKGYVASIGLFVLIILILFRLYIGYIRKEQHAE